MPALFHSLHSTFFLFFPSSLISRILTNKIIIEISVEFLTVFFLVIYLGSLVVYENISSCKGLQCFKGPCHLVFDIYRGRLLVKPFQKQKKFSSNYILININSLLENRYGEHAEIIKNDHIYLCSATLVIEMETC